MFHILNIGSGKQRPKIAKIVSFTIQTQRQHYKKTQIQIMSNKEQSQKTNTHLPLPQRLTYHQWRTRKAALQQIQHLLTDSQPDTIIYIGGHQYSVQKLIPLLMNLTDQKHTSVLLRGLSCVDIILRKKINKKGKSQYGKHFFKLVNEGLEKFPLLVQLRSSVLQKFSELLQLIEIEPRMLRDKLYLPHQKSIFYALQIIGMLEMVVLRDDVRELANRHPKEEVRQLASQILQELQENQYHIEQQEQGASNQNVSDNKVSYNNHVNNKTNHRDKSQTNRIPLNNNYKKKDKDKNSNGQDGKNNTKRIYLLETLSKFQQLSAKEQQKFSSELLQQIDGILGNSIPVTLDFAHYIRLMVEDNNLIIHTNGLKILTSWFRNSQTLNKIPNSYPLLFILDKFKRHSTHPINSVLYQLADAIIAGGRLIDLMQAVADGVSSAKINVKFGASMLCVRVVSAAKQNQQFFYQNWQGQSQFPQHLDIDVAKYRNLDRYLQKCCQSLCKDKDRNFKGIGESMKIVMGYHYNFSNQQTTQSREKTMSTKGSRNLLNCTNTRSNQHIRQTTIPTKSSTFTRTATNPLYPPTSTGTSIRNKRNHTTTSSYTNGSMGRKPEQLMKKVIKLSSQSTLNSKKQLKEVLALYINQVNNGLKQNRYSLFFLSQVLQSLLRNYTVQQQTTHQISQFLITNLHLLTSHKPQTNSKLEHLPIIFRIFLCQIVLGKQLSVILNNISENYGIKEVIKMLLIVDGRVRKRNREVMVEWLNGLVSVELLDQKYYQLVRRVETGEILSGVSDRDNRSMTTTVSTPQQISNQYRKLQLLTSQQSNYDPYRRQDKDYTVETVMNQNYQRQDPPSAHKKLRQVKDELYNQSPQSKMQEIPEIFQEVSPNYLNNLQNIEEINCELSNIVLQDQDDYEQGKNDHEDKWEYFISKHQSKTSRQQKTDRNAEINPKVEQVQQSIQQKVQEQQSHSEPQESHHSDELHQKFDNNLQDMKKWLNNYTEQPQKIQQSPQYAPKSPKDAQLIQDNRNIKQGSLSDPDQDQQGQEHQLTDEHQQENEQDIEYEIINTEKLNYMLDCTTNPYPHLRTLIVIPFKNHSRRQHFLSQLTHFLSSRPLKQPQPYNAVLLMTILLFAEIKNDKSLISPLQQLYQHLASQTSTNQFLKTILSLLHSVMQQTLSSCRSFLITILSKSICRLLPFAEDSLELLRDIQQFYQIGQMVYFQMYEMEYKQVKIAIQGNALEETVGKAFVKEGGDLKVIVEGWLETGFKSIVQHYIQRITTQE